jgi:hypothetical protein
LATSAGLGDKCEDEVIRALMATREASPKKLKDGDHDRDASCHNDERFFAEQVGSGGFRKCGLEGGESGSDSLRTLDRC